MELFKLHSSYPKVNAQRNLCDRTHYVDDDTLRFHKCKVLSSHVVDHGLLFAIVTSDALDYENTKRGFRYVIFDLFGTTVARPNLEQAFKTRNAATKAMWSQLNQIDAKAHTFAAIDNAEKAYAKEMQWLRTSVAAIENDKAAAS